MGVPGQLMCGCADFEETFDHFMKCKNYKKENKYETNWKEIIQDGSKNKEKLIIAREAIERRNMRKKTSTGWPTSSGSQGSIV